MRKRLISPNIAENLNDAEPWLDLQRLAQVEVTSEDSAFPIEAALTLHDAPGWKADAAGEQTVRLLFDEPQSVRLVQLLFEEALRERPQEFVLSWSAGDGFPLREIVRQQFHFSPGGAVRELENYQVALDDVRMIELKIIPDRNGGAARATLAQLRIA